TNVVLTDTPSNATFGPQSSSNLIAQMSSNGASHTWTLPQLAPGATLTVTFTLYSPAVGQFSNTAIVKADQPSLSCRSYSSTIHTWATDSSSGGPPPQSPTQNYIAGVYRDLLGRQPDSG